MGGNKESQWVLVGRNEEASVSVSVFKLATFFVALTTLCIKLNQVSSLNTGNFICKCPLNLNWPILMGGRTERESLALIKITC